MAIKRIASVIGGAVVLTGGVYYTIQIEKLAGLEYAEKEALKHVQQQNNKIQSITSESQQQHALVTTLQQSAEVERRSSAQLRTKLEAARREVQVLESQLSDKEAVLARIFQDAKTAQDRITSLGEERLKASEAITVYQEDLAKVRSRVVETKAYLNPLNHPAVKDLLKQMRS